MVIDQGVKGQVSTPFLAGPSCGLTYDEKTLVRAHLHLVLFQLECRFFLFGTPLLTLTPSLGAHPNDGKNQLDFQIQNFMLNHLKT